MNDIAINVIANLIAGAIGGTIVLILNYINKKFLDTQVKWKWAILLVGLATLALSAFLTTLGHRLFSPSQVANLAEYLPLDLVDDDLDGSDFRWVSSQGELFKQVDEPRLAQATVGSVSGRFVRFPVQLSSTKDATNYSGGDRMAILQRKLRDTERRDWDTLLVTLYIQTDDPDDRHEIFVSPYLSIPGIGTLYLGFGQTIRVNQWTPIVWRQLIASTDWHNEFFDDLYAIQDKYEIEDVGHIRLTHVLTGVAPIK